MEVNIEMVSDSEANHIHELSAYIRGTGCLYIEIDVRQLLE